MTITFIVVGKTDSRQVGEITGEYLKRTRHFVPLKEIVVPDIKGAASLAADQRKAAEGEQILRHIAKGDFVVLLDENGEQYGSTGFAGFLNKKMNAGTRNLVFVIGGPYGFTPDVYRRADHTLSLSRMTFSHQFVRAIFAEQLYRALTIINNLPYHHQ